MASSVSPAGRPETDPRLVVATRPVVHMSVVGTPVDGVNQEHIVECIASLQETTRDAPFDVRVTAVVNAPGSALARRLRERFPTIEVVENQLRKGYSANHNAALAGSEAQYLLICNDDIVFLPRSLERAIAYMEEPANSRVGVVAFQLLNPDGSVQNSTYAFPTMFRTLLGLSGLREFVPFGGLTYRIARMLQRGQGRSRFWSHDRTLPVETFMGAIMLVRTAALAEVGTMDELTLLGGEETEWHMRFWKAGWSVVFLHDARITHYGSQTLRVLPGLEVEYLKGILNFFWRHRSRATFRAVCALAWPIVAVRAALSAIRRDGAFHIRRACMHTLVEGIRGRAPRSAA